MRADLRVTSRGDFWTILYFVAENPEIAFGTKEPTEVVIVELLPFMKLACFTSAYPAMVDLESLLNTRN
jgi:hypothetical protein